MSEKFTQDDYEILKRDVLFEGFLRLTRYHLRYRRFNHEWSKIFSREVVERKAAAAVLLYDPKLDQLVLIEQFRVGALLNPQSPWLIEIVAGVYTDENPDEVARRESEEEAGCKILDIYPICKFFVSPGGSNEFLHLYIGRIDASNAGGIHGLEEEDEDIRAFTVSIDEAFKLLQEGKILIAPAIISIQWLQLNRGWLKQLWLTK